MSVGPFVAALSLPLSIALSIAPASAMAFQPSPRNADGRSNIVDPDERGEAMADRMRQSDERIYARPSLNGMSLVAPTGAAATPHSPVLALPR